MSKMIKYHFLRGENPSLFCKNKSVRFQKNIKNKLVRLPQYNQTKRQFNGGDGGNRTHVQNGSKQISTGVVNY